MNFYNLIYKKLSPKVIIKLTFSSPSRIVNLKSGVYFILTAQGNGSDLITVAQQSLGAGGIAQGPYYFIYC